jgi:outer membrane protein OmpA-like peptidoglycan-associated protein
MILLRKFKSLVWVLVLLCAPVALIAQAWAQPRAQSLYTKALEYIQKHDQEEAEQCLIKCIKAAPSFSDAYISLGMLYCDKRQYTKAADVFQQATLSCPSCTRNFALPLAKALSRAGQYDKADIILNGWQKPQPMNPALAKEYEQVKRNVQYGKYAMNAKHTEQPENMGARINSQYDEYFPSIVPDDSTIVFTRRTNGVDEDFYIARRDSCGGWFIARDMGSPPNSPLQDGAQMLSADFHYLFFMRCGSRSDNGWDAGGCDLYFSYTQGNEWSQAVPFGATINTPAYEGMPTLSSDNRELYFVSDREGGFGGKDIWVSRFQDGLWQIPENLGPTVNTAYDETAPFIAADNSTLYFTSDGHPGLGGNDVFYSKKSNGKWQRPENIGYPFNTAFDDVSMCISPDGKKAYMASDRDGGLGAMDLYEVKLPEVARPEPFTYVYGIAYDSLDQKRLTYAQIEWNDAQTGEKLYRFQSNRGDATYMAAIPLNRTYAVHVFRTGYADYDDTITYTASHILPPDTLSFPLLDFNYSPPLYDTLIGKFHFVKNNINLSDSDMVKLRTMVEPFLKTPLAEYFVNGYTDNSGTPLINEELSFARARTIADLLRSYGVPDYKIQTQGWADASPLVPNDTEENRFTNRRVELTVRRP